jgi:hypothetical protein
MPLQTSGAISLNDIHIEAGGSSGSQASINDQDIRDLIGKGSGAQMSFSEWYGAAAGPSIGAISTFSSMPTSTSSNLDMAYLKGTNDTVVAGAVFSQPLKYIQFGTNNRLSTWGSGTPSLVDLPSQYNTTGNRAFTAGAVDGMQKFIVTSENWLGYTTGVNMAIYSMDGSSSSPSRVSNWQQAFGNQASPVNIQMDPFNPRNGVVLTEYLHNMTNYNDIYGIFFQVNTAGTSLSIQYPQMLTSGGTSAPHKLKGAIYRNGRLLLHTMRGGSTYNRTHYLTTGQVNTSSGHLSSVGSSYTLRSNSYTYGADGRAQNVFYLNNQFCVLYEDDSLGSSNCKVKLTRVSFSGNSISTSSTVDTGMDAGVDKNIRYVIGEWNDSSNDTVFMAFRSSDSYFKEEAWQLSGSTFTKTWENTVLADTIHKTVNNGPAGTTPKSETYYQSGGMRQTSPRYTKDGKILAQLQSEGYNTPHIMPWYWST